MLQMPTKKYNQYRIEEQIDREEFLKYTKLQNEKTVQF